MQQLTSELDNPVEETAKPEGREEENPLQGGNSSRRGGGAALHTEAAMRLKRIAEPMAPEEDTTTTMKPQKSRAK